MDGLLDLAIQLSFASAILFAVMKLYGAAAGISQESPWITAAWILGALAMPIIILAGMVLIDRCTTRTNKH